MKKYFLLFIVGFMFGACSRKTVPAKGTNGTITSGNNTTTNNKANNNITTDTSSVLDTSFTVNNTAFAFIVVSNGYGKIITQKDSLPADANVQFNTLELSKGFSAQQLSNLKARYKTIPPRVLYVNPQKEQTSARGTFYVLAKKFWYWKKSDGLFYLDEKYYL